MANCAGGGLFLESTTDYGPPAIYFGAIEVDYTVVPSVVNTDKGNATLFVRTNGIATPGAKTQLCIVWEDDSITVLAEGPAS